MKLAKTFLRLLAVGAVLSCAVPGAGAQAKPVSKPATKAKTATTSAKSSAPATPAAGASAPAVTADSISNKRDPFAPLINDKKETSGPEHLPPGKAGLVVATVRVDGTIKSPNGMLAMVSNPEQHVYFIREGDQLYDGNVEKIAIDGVTFRENSKDAFGKPVEREVTKRLYPSAGEQQ
jgi:Tfp pilus assembly protein PilP